MTEANAGLDPREGELAPFELDLEGRHFVRALVLLGIATVVLFTITLFEIFREHRSSFARLEGFPYSYGEPPTRPESWPSSDELGAAPGVMQPRPPSPEPAAPNTGVVRKFFDTAWGAVRKGENGAFLQSAGQLVAAAPSSGVEAMLDQHILAEEAAEMFTAVWIAAERLRRSGGKPQELLRMGTPSMFMNRMLKLAEPGPQAELIIRHTIDLFGAEAARAAALQLGPEWEVRASVRVALLDSATGREAFFVERTKRDPGDGLHSVAPFLEAADEPWVRTLMGSEQGPKLALVAGLAGVLHERMGAFEEELSGPFRELLREQLETQPAAQARSSIIAVRYIPFDYAAQLLLGRLGRCTEIAELPQLNQSLLYLLRAEHGSALAAIVGDEGASLGARTYAALMLLNLTRRAGQPALWSPAEAVSVPVFRQAMRDGDGTLRLATFAVLLLDGFDAGHEVVRELLMDPGNTSLQMFLVKHLKDRADFTEDLKALRDDPAQKPIVRDGVRRMFPE